MRELWLDASALQHNLHQVKLRAPRSKILAMVKANAYGHGLAWAARHLHAAGADGFGVASLSEADIIHQLALDRPIVLMSGPQTAEELQHALAHQYAIVVHNAEQVEFLEQIKTDHRLTVWLKIDTGMHRLGFAPDEIKNIWQRLDKLPFIQKPIILTTHFSDANEIHQLTTAKQSMLFHLTRSTLPDDAKVLSSLANSAGILSWPETHADWVRPGIMLYGASPFSSNPAAEYQLKPVMTVCSRIIALKNLASGSQVGYGGTFTCPKPMRIAIVAFGYGDGYPWHAHFSDVLIKGQRYPVIGRISMDMLQVDVTGASDIKLNDLVTLWGKDLPVELLAVTANTISYEILTNLQRHRLAIYDTITHPRLWIGDAYA
jgi:alanine racemase